MIWQTFGHKTVKDILQKQLQAEQLSHAYFFCGPAGLGKKALALEFAKKLLRTERLENHFDFKILDVESEIKIEFAREFMSQLSYKPFLGKWKVAIINNTQNLNSESGTALLKTLEEPSSSTIIILIANNKSLLPTIVSRCQVFNFNRFSARQLAEYAKKQGLTSTEKILRLAFGSVGRLRRLCEDKKFLETEDQLAQDLERLKVLPAPERLLSISDYSDLEIQDLKRIFSSWIFWQLQGLKTGRKNFSLLGFLHKALADLETNKNKKFVLQGLFLNM